MTDREIVDMLLGLAADDQLDAALRSCTPAQRERYAAAVDRTGVYSDREVDELIAELDADPHAPTLDTDRFWLLTIGQQERLQRAAERVLLRATRQAERDWWADPTAPAPPTGIWVWDGELAAEAEAELKRVAE